MKDRLLKYNRQVPRYTSYPPANHFKPLDEPLVRDWVHYAASAPVSLYVHVPFCKEMCWYCGCHTAATHKYAPVEDYVTLLLREARLLRDAMECSARVAQLHFGGGSPTMLSPEDFSRIMTSLRELFDFSATSEIAIEADPRGATHDRVAAYAEQGVNRASFGVQDFAPHVQRAINRVQSAATVHRAADLFRNAGIGNISFDLMYGLPLQTAADIESTVDQSMALQPKRIALFGYAHVPWMKKHMRLIRDEDLPGAGARIDLFNAAEARLAAHGMIPVGLDHFVHKDDAMLQALVSRKLHRNFQGYTTDPCDTLLGLGLSSISKLPQGYAQNFASMPQYEESVLAGRLPVTRGHILTADDRLRAAIIEELMCYLEADIGALLARHGAEASRFDDALSSLKPLQDDGLIAIDARKIAVNPAARQAVRIVAAAFDAYLSDTPRRHAQVA